MWDFDIGRALVLIGRNLPFILLRIAVYAGIAIAMCWRRGWVPASAGPSAASAATRCRGPPPSRRGGPYRRAGGTARRQDAAGGTVNGREADLFIPLGRRAQFTGSPGRLSRCNSSTAAAICRQIAAPSASASKSPPAGSLDRSVGVGLSDQ